MNAYHKGRRARILSPWVFSFDLGNRLSSLLHTNGICLPLLSVHSNRKLWKHNKSAKYLRYKIVLKILSDSQGDEKKRNSRNKVAKWHVLGTMKNVLYLFVIETAVEHTRTLFFLQNIHTSLKRKYFYLNSNFSWRSIIASSLACKTPCPTSHRNFQ